MENENTFVEKDQPAMNNNNSTLETSELPVLKVTPVTKLQNELLETPVSSAGEEDDAVDFLELLKTDPLWNPPPIELETKIRSLLEHYFSDENLVKDKFLLKHVKRNRLGYVSVKLLTSFKKLKNLSKSDWKITAYCLSKSEKFILNKPGTKVRRKDPLPEVDLPTTSIKTLLYKLPDTSKDPTMEEISEQFQEFGELTTVRIIKPGKDIPADLRNHTTKHPELGLQVCVVIEFESTDAAQNAYKSLSKLARDENKPEMYSLLGSGRNPRKHVLKSLGKNRDYYDSSEDSQSPYVSSRETSPMMRRKFNGRGTPPFGSPQGSRDGSPVRNGKSPKGSPVLPRRNLPNSNHPTSNSGPWRKLSRESTPESSPRGSPMSGRKHTTHHTSPLAMQTNLLTPGDAPQKTSPSGGSSPWLQRKRQLVASQGNSPVTTPGSSPLLGRKFQDGVPVGVTRLPRGPPTQGAKGFDVSLRRTVKGVKMLEGLKEELHEMTIVN